MKISHILLTLLFLLSSCGSDENSYKSHNETLKDVENNKGMMPEWVPSDAINLYETHNIENSAVFGRFEYSEMNFIDSNLFSADSHQKDSIYNKISNINKPRIPTWFISDSLFYNKTTKIYSDSSSIIIWVSDKNRVYFFSR